MDVTPPVIDPSKLSFESPYFRRVILASYWIVIILALPIWWNITSIERLSLPENRVQVAAKRTWPFPPPELSPGSSHRTVKYSSRYRLAFTLLNEDAGSGNGAISWEVQESLERYLRPTLDKLSVLHNFTIESQVQYHAPLAFQPTVTENNGATVHGLTQEDLTVFVNSAQWTLSSSASNDPVLHFLLFVPSSTNTPLYILDTNGYYLTQPKGRPMTSNAFILPQWGGIVLLNQPEPHLTTPFLRPTFSIFQQQLLVLLGATSERNSNGLSDSQLDQLLRRRTYENVEDTKETLESITALVKQIANMPVGQDVKGDVQDSLNFLDQAFATAGLSHTAALLHSSQALKLASRAFFNPGMLALLYFPAEHTYAVYTPLFASIAGPLVAAVVREVLAWRRARKQNQTSPSADGGGVVAGKPKNE